MMHTHTQNGRVATGVEVVRGSSTCALCLVHCGLCRITAEQKQEDGKVNVAAKREVLVSAGVVCMAVYEWCLSLFSHVCMLHACMYACIHNVVSDPLLVQAGVPADLYVCMYV